MSLHISFNIPIVNHITDNFSKCSLSNDSSSSSSLSSSSSRSPSSRALDQYLAFKTKAFTAPNLGEKIQERFPNIVRMEDCLLPNLKKKSDSIPKECGKVLKQPPADRVNRIFEYWHKNSKGAMGKIDNLFRLLNMEASACKNFLVNLPIRKDLEIIFQELTLLYQQKATEEGSKFYFSEEHVKTPEGLAFVLKYYKFIRTGDTGAFILNIEDSDGAPLLSSLEEMQQHKVEEVRILANKYIAYLSHEYFQKKLLAADVASDSDLDFFNTMLETREDVELVKQTTPLLTSILLAEFGLRRYPHKFRPVFYKIQEEIGKLIGEVNQQVLLRAKICQLMFEKTSPQIQAMMMLGFGIAAPDQFATLYDDGVFCKKIGLHKFNGETLNICGPDTRKNESKVELKENKSKANVKTGKIVRPASEADLKKVFSSRSSSSSSSSSTLSALPRHWKDNPIPWTFHKRVKEWWGLELGKKPIFSTYRKEWENPDLLEESRRFHAFPILISQLACEPDFSARRTADIEGSERTSIYLIVQLKFSDQPLPLYGYFCLGIGSDNVCLHHFFRPIKMDSFKQNYLIERIKKCPVPSDVFSEEGETLLDTAVASDADVGEADGRLPHIPFVQIDAPNIKALITVYKLT